MEGREGCGTEMSKIDRDGDRTGRFCWWLEGYFRSRIQQADEEGLWSSGRSQWKATAGLERECRVIEG